MKITISDILAPALTVLIMYLYSPDFFSMPFSSTEKTIEYLIAFAAICFAVNLAVVVLNVLRKRVM